MKYILEIKITNFDAVTLGWFLKVLFLVLVCLVILVAIKGFPHFNTHKIK